MRSADSRAVGARGCPSAGWPPARVVDCTSSARGRAVRHGSTPSRATHFPPTAIFFMAVMYPASTHRRDRCRRRYSSLLPSTILLYGVSSLRPKRTQQRDESAAAAPQDERSARHAVHGTQCEARSAWNAVRGFASHGPTIGSPRARRRCGQGKSRRGCGQCVSGRTAQLAPDDLDRMRLDRVVDAQQLNVVHSCEHRRGFHGV